MENKSKKTSINSVIYLLISAMLVCVVLVSVFTVASRRRTDKETPPALTDSPIVTSAEDTSEKPRDTLPAVRPAEPTDRHESDAPSDTASAADISDDIPVSAPENAPASVEIRYFVIPTAGTVAKEFEIDVPVYSLTMNDYRAHTGIDIAAPIGTDVLSASNGTVCRIWNDKLMGRCVTVDHGDDIYTTYMNLSEDSASNYSVGDKVAMGQSIGAVGESAIIEISEEPHLHLEMKVNGSYVDPLEYMGITSPQEAVYAE